MSDVSPWETPVPLFMILLVRVKKDDRVILGLSFDGEKINAEWIEMEKYLDAK